MLERLLDDERVTEVDLGAGDDPYKRLWTSRRRERVGLVGFDPGTLRGSAGMLRHVLTQRLRPASDHRRRATRPGIEASGPGGVIGPCLAPR
jgi:CelD/BcsL family acetyltransferase involved in cellulose biosynthesis